MERTVKRAYIFNTGCIRRALDLTRVYEYLVKNGWVFTNNLSLADLVVISTCGSVQDDEDLSLAALKHAAKKKGKSAQIVVTGCLPVINPESVGKIQGLEKYKFSLKSIEGNPESKWLLLDYSDIVVHIFDPELRKFYDLERLWQDARRLRIPSVSKHGPAKRRRRKRAK